MKPKLIDRLIMICICFDLVMGFWYISQNFPAHSQMIAAVF